MSLKSTDPSDGRYTGPSAQTQPPSRRVEPCVRGDEALEPIGEADHDVAERCIDLRERLAGLVVHAGSLLQDEGASELARARQPHRVP